MPTVRIPLNLRNPRISTLSGNSYFTVTGLTAHDFGNWQFINGVDGKVYGTVLIPNNIAASPNAKIGLAIYANATTGVVRLQVSEKAITATSSLDPSSLTAETAQNITVPATVNTRSDVTFPASGNLAETVAANNLLIVEIARIGSNAADTLTVNMGLAIAWLQIDVS